MNLWVHKWVIQIFKVWISKEKESLERERAGEIRQKKRWDR